MNKVVIKILQGSVASQTWSNHMLGGLTIGLHPPVANFL